MLYKEDLINAMVIALQPELNQIDKQLENCVVSSFVDKINLDSDAIINVKVKTNHNVMRTAKVLKLLLKKHYGYNIVETFFEDDNTIEIGICI